MQIPQKNFVRWTFYLKKKRYDKISGNDIDSFVHSWPSVNLSSIEISEK